MKRLKNPNSAVDPWAPDFEVGGGCWLYRKDNRAYFVREIADELITFSDGQGKNFTLAVEEAAKLMRPT